MTAVSANNSESPRGGSRTGSIAQPATEMAEALLSGKAAKADAVYRGAELGHLELDKLPEALAMALREFDTNGDGKVDAAELMQHARHFKEGREHKAEYAIEIFPESLHSAMKVFDLDGDGAISTEELAAGAQMYAQARQTQKRLWRTVAMLLLVVLLLLAAILGLTVAAVELSKETSTDGATGVMTVKGTQGAPVAVQTARQQTEVPLGAIPHLGMGFLQQLDAVVAQHQHDGKVYRLSIAEGVINEPGGSLATLYTSRDMVLDIVDLTTVRVYTNYSSGEFFPVCGPCSKASAISVVLTDEQEKRLDKYLGEAAAAIASRQAPACGVPPAGAAGSSARKLHPLEVHARMPHRRVRALSGQGDPQARAEEEIGFCHTVEDLRPKIVKATANGDHVMIRQVQASEEDGGSYAACTWRADGCDYTVVQMFEGDTYKYQLPKAVPGCAGAGTRKLVGCIGESWGPLSDAPSMENVFAGQIGDPADGAANLLEFDPGWQVQYGSSFADYVPLNEGDAVPASVLDACVQAPPPEAMCDAAEEEFGAVMYDNGDGEQSQADMGAASASAAGRSRRLHPQSTAAAVREPHPTPADVRPRAQQEGAARARHATGTARRALPQAAKCEDLPGQNCQIFNFVQCTNVFPIQLMCAGTCCQYPTAVAGVEAHPENNGCSCAGGDTPAPPTPPPTPVPTQGPDATGGTLDAAGLWQVAMSGYPLTLYSWHGGNNKWNSGHNTFCRNLNGLDGANHDDLVSAGPEEPWREGWNVLSADEWQYMDAVQVTGTLNGDRGFAGTVKATLVYKKPVIGNSQETHRHGTLALVFALHDTWWTKDYVKNHLWGAPAVQPDASAAPDLWVNGVMYDMMTALMAGGLEAKLDALVADKPGWSIDYVVGHSIGGAMATLFVQEYHQIKSKAYLAGTQGVRTFGAPPTRWLGRAWIASKDAAFAESPKVTKWLQGKLSWVPPVEDMSEAMLTALASKRAHGVRQFIFNDPVPGRWVPKKGRDDGEYVHDVEFAQMYVHRPTSGPGSRARGWGCDQFCNVFALMHQGTCQLTERARCHPKNMFLMNSCQTDTSDRISVLDQTLDSNGAGDDGWSADDGVIEKADWATSDAMHGGCTKWYDFSGRASYVNSKKHADGALKKYRSPMIYNGRTRKLVQIEPVVRWRKYRQDRNSAWQCKVKIVGINWEYFKYIQAFTFHENFQDEA